MTCFRSRWLPLLRVLVLGFFALALVLQPVMATAGEMHGLSHGPSGKHARALHADDVDLAIAVAGEQDQYGAKTLHLLMHFAHCCGATATLSPLLKLLPAMPAAGRVAITEALIPLQARLPTPFKPPISA